MVASSNSNSYRPVPVFTFARNLNKHGCQGSANQIDGDPMANSSSFFSALRAHVAATTGTDTYPVQVVIHLNTGHRLRLEVPPPCGNVLADFSPATLPMQAMHQTSQADRADAPGEEADAPVDPPPQHSDDFRTFACRHGTFAFSAAQAAIVGVLFESWRRNVPDVGGNHLLAEAGSNSRHISDLFEGHPAWKTLIVSHSRGTFRLNLGKVA